MQDVSLLNARHRDPATAALSVAASRADKAARLRAEGLASVADRYADNLFYDVREWIAGTVAGTNASDQTCERLHAEVACARGESAS